MILNKIKINGGGNMLIYLAKIKTKPMGIEENFNAADREIKKAIAANADIVILPCAFLTGYNIGIDNRNLIDVLNKGAETFLAIE